MTSTHLVIRQSVLQYTLINEAMIKTLLMINRFYIFAISLRNISNPALRMYPPAKIPFFANILMSTFPSSLIQQWLRLDINSLDEFQGDLVEQERDEDREKRSMPHA